MPPRVTLPSIFVQELFTAVFTLPRLNTGMSFDVEFVLGGRGKSSTAMITAVRLLALKINDYATKN